MENVTKYHIRRTTRNTLVTNLFVLALLLLITWTVHTYYYNFFFGPFPLSGADLVAIHNIESREQYFVTVNGDTTYDTGIYQVEKDVDQSSKLVRSQTTKGYYQALLIDHRLLIVYTEHQSTATSFSGVLSHIPYDLQEEFIDKTDSTVHDAFLPFYLDATSFRSSGYWGLVFLLPVYGITFWILRKAIRMSRNPSLHPIYNSLQQYGDPVEISNSIDNEFLIQEHFTKLPGCTLSASWLVVTNFYKTDFIPINDILWIYKQRTKHSVNFIPSGSSYKAILITRSGNRMEINAKEKAVNTILETIFQRIPWIQIGYSDQLMKIFRKDLQQLTANVDTRREELLQQAKK